MLHFACLSCSRSVGIFEDEVAPEAPCRRYRANDMALNDDILDWSARLRGCLTSEEAIETGRNISMATDTALQRGHTLPKLELAILFALASFGCAEECDSEEAAVPGACRSCELVLDQTTTGVVSRATFALEGKCAGSISGVVLTEEGIFRLLDVVLPGETDDNVGSFGLQGSGEEVGEFTATLLIQNTKADDEIHPVRLLVLP